MIKTDRYELYQGDCLEVMDRLIENGIKVDMILTDLPYGTTQNKWDSVIPLDEMWKRINKLIKVNTPILFFAQDMFSAELMFSNKKIYKYKAFWKKDRPGGFLNAKRMPLKDVEEILFFYQKQPLYNPQMTEGKPNHSIGKVEGEDFCKNNNNYGKFSRVNNKGNLKYPRQVLEFPREHPPIHPTQKPVALLEYLIKTYTNENDLVLDFTMGSGSTGVACMNTNRRFIGIELEENYFNIAKERITECKQS